jgi:hypothetical protein
LEQALNKREIENREIVPNDGGTHQVSGDRPVTTPLLTSPHDGTVGQEPPKTAMSPKEFTKVRSRW